MALSKVFAVGEVLTAQDVNDHLVNRFDRYELNDPGEIFSSTSAVILAAVAVLDVDQSGRGTCSLAFSIQGGSSVITAGDQRFEIGQLAPSLSPSQPFGFSGYFSNGSLQGASTAGGQISIRWASSGTGNHKYFNTGSYPVGI